MFGIFVLNTYFSTNFSDMGKTTPRFENLKPLATKNRLTALTIVWSFGVLCLMAVQTDLFRHYDFKPAFIAVYLLMAINTLFIGKLWKIYIENRQQK